MRRMEGICLYKIPIIWHDGKIVSLEMTERLDSLQENLNMLKVY